jgi:glucose dehydrogenase
LVNPNVDCPVHRLITGLGRFDRITVCLTYAANFDNIQTVPKARYALLKYETFARGRSRRAGTLLTSTALAPIPAFLALALALAIAPIRAATPPPAAGYLDAARLLAADSEPHNWFTTGRDKDGSYYSPLAGIDAKNVKRLGFAWQYDLGLPMRGQEATPIVIDGVMYTSGTWGYVYAVDAATGRELWRYDPKPDYFFGRHPCCDLVNRGVAVWKGKVYVASTDGRLHALDAATGRKIWEADTITDHKLPYSSTGAPQIAGGVVVIGNGGADMGHTAVRGRRLRFGHRRVQMALLYSSAGRRTTV